MSRLHVRPRGEHGKVTSITPQSAGWKHVGFEVHKLAKGEIATASTSDREVCLVAEAHGPFEQGERPGQVALAEGQ